MFTLLQLKACTELKDVVMEGFVLSVKARRQNLYGRCRLCESELTMQWRRSAAVEGGTEPLSLLSG